LDPHPNYATCLFLRSYFLFLLEYVIAFKAWVCSLPLVAKSPDNYSINWRCRLVLNSVTHILDLKRTGR